MTLPNLAAWWSQQSASIPAIAWWFLVIALVVSAIGFVRVVYFISIGYAFSIVAMTVVSASLFRSNLTWFTAMQSVGLIAWGLRLGAYLLQRERRSASYRERLAGIETPTSNVTLLQRALIWVAVSALYFLMFSPSLFGLLAAPQDHGLLQKLTQGIGLAAMAAGLAIESVADQQKAAFKARTPNRFCDVGLYRWVRCPNYLGEIVFWAGNWIMGIAFYGTALRWLFSGIGLVCIVLIMLGSTKRLEFSQDKRYGENADYQAYVRNVPVLFPFVKVYSLKGVRVYLE